MRAVHMTRPGGPEVLEPIETGAPTIEHDHEIRVRVRAAGINPIDTKLRTRGTFFPENMPAILGCDGAGVVEEAGSGVTHVSPGDEIYYCYGGLGQKRCGNYAEQAVVDATYAARKPAGLDFTHAAAAPLVLITAWEALFDRARLREGRRVLIHAGAGGVGHVAIQLARQAGARVATTVSSEEKADFVRRLGAERVIHYNEEDFADAVLAWTDGEGVDAALDTVGGETCARTARAVRFYGDLVTLLQADEMDWKEARIRNLRVSQELMLSPMLFDMHGAAAHQRHILEKCALLFERGDLAIHVARTFPLDGAAEAHAQLEEGGFMGKLALVTE